MSSNTSENKITSLDTITKFCKRKGFVYSGSEIYGGLANTWDLGPKGVLLSNNIKKIWKDNFIYHRNDMYEMDASILMNQKIWEASGHTGGFADCLVDCKECKARLRADHLIENSLDQDVEGKTAKEITDIIIENNIKCPECGKTNWTDARYMNLMFETNRDKINSSINVLEELLQKAGDGDVTFDKADIADLQDKLDKQKNNRIYLRPETAQAIFVQYKNILQTERPKIPFGIGQIGKAFRNEITPGNFLFRVIEFEQMEVEYFIKEENWQETFEDFLKLEQKVLTQDLGIDPDNIKLKEHEAEKLSHYSKRTVDIEYRYPHGFGELWGLAYRTNFDLSQHAKHSGQKMEYLDAQTGEKFIPHVIEPSVGAGRLMMTVLFDAYNEEELENETRTVLKFPYEVAPYKIAVLPLMKKGGMKEKALEVLKELKEKGIVCDYDDAGSIGKRYRRQDENGTPWCLTIDFDTIEDGTATLRHRDTMKQVGANERIQLDQLDKFLNKNEFGL